MEISADSFRLMLSIFKAVGENGSAMDYNLLLQTFEERDSHDIALADSEIRFQAEEENLEIIVGRDNEVERLLSELLDSGEKGKQLSAIPILGGCGIGKTSVARWVYEAIAVKNYFEVRVWVKVDGPEFKLPHAAQQILKSAMGMSCSLDDQHELDEMVRDTLQSQRCLIVFDGVEYMAKDSWVHINKFWFDFVDFGSKVLVTTTSTDVAYLVLDQPFRLKQLSGDDSLLLCRRLAFNSSDMVEEISRPMAENLEFLCHGTPLLLKLVGNLMRYDHKIRDLVSMGYIGDNLWPAWNASVAILLCVWALPSQLRQCFAYSTLFPKGYSLNKEKVIDMWIAHDLLKPYPGSNSLEDMGNAYFFQLLDRAFFSDIRRNQYGDIIEFCIPGLIHEIGANVARVVYKEKLGLIGFIGEDAGRLSLDLQFEWIDRPEDMQTLILSPILYSRSSLNCSLLDFQGLQSLDLSCSGIQTLLDDIWVLRELRYLNLSYTLIERLPDAITGLSRLETLDLSWCYRLKVLPKEMCLLIQMRHLDLSSCDSLSYFPFGISSLKSLASMPLFILGKDDDCARLGDLGALNQLRGRLEIRNLENVRQITEAQNAKLVLKNLQHLVLAWSQNAGDSYEVIELLQPNTLLKFLDLTGYMGYRFPRWISSLKSLIKITVTDCGCLKLPSLGQLPFLKELQLNRMRNIERIDQEFYGNSIADESFPSLEQLELSDLPTLLEWSGATLPRASKLPGLARLFSSGTDIPNASISCIFRSLKTLTVEGCPNLPSLPNLPTLPNLIVSSCNKSILSSLASFTSLSSLLINDMEVVWGMSSGVLGRLESLKKLILSNINDESIGFHKQRRFTALEHLGILHCHGLPVLSLNFLPSLQKLHIVDCQDLNGIFVREEEDTQLVELVLEDCPRAFSNISFHKFHRLRKLILKNCGHDFSIYFAGKFKKLEKLEYLFVSGCPKVESELQAFPWLISHIPCLIVGDHKSNSMDSKDLREDPVSASYEQKPQLKVLSPVRFSHGPQKLTTEQSIHNAKAIKYREIKKATRNFGPDMLLGEGGFGRVFKGWIDDPYLTALKPGFGIPVAVKIWRTESNQGHTEWLSEVKYLSQLRHPNIVKLIGYCNEKDSRILVYEFVHRGSLNYHLFARGSQSLSWATRIKVVVGAARALSFLHELEIPVIHRDVKSGNILLDDEFTAKLSDFGIAIDSPTDDMTHESTLVKGTYGYIAPEYPRTGQLSTKSDVYGFGVVLLEILTGFRASGTNLPSAELLLVEWAKPYLGNKKKLLGIMDTRLEGHYTRHEAYMVAKLASECLSLDPKERPRMTEVVVALEQLCAPEAFKQREHPSSAFQRRVPHTARVRLQE